VFIAKIQLDELRDVREAIAAWRNVREFFGADEETFSALFELLESQQRWDELATLLSEQAGAIADVARRVELYVRLGDLVRDRIPTDLERAASSYREALTLDPRHTGARRGLASLIHAGEVRAVVLDALSRGYVETGDWGNAAELASAL